MSIFVVSLLIYVFASISRYIDLSSSNKNLIHAYELAQEEIEALRSLTFDKLVQPADNNFMNVAYNVGDWQVVLDDTRHVYELKSPGSLSGVTGLQLLPLGDLQNIILEGDIKILSSGSPTGWRAGLYFYYQDKNNYYQLSFSPNNLSLIKKVAGVELTLYSAAPATAFDIWYTYKAQISAGNIKIYRNSVELASITDASLSSGKAALLGLNSVHAYFDDIKIDGTLVTNGDFVSGPHDQVADGWERLGINDLPAGQTTLTIQDHNSSADIKKITAKVLWREGNRNREVSLQTLISKYGLHLK
ncbi:MAG: hypothetical protein WC528_02245 [Patescibacteria group bacterium]